MAHLLRHDDSSQLHPIEASTGTAKSHPAQEEVLSNASSERNRVQKVLKETNVKTGSVLTDVFGVSGQLILDALLEGKATVEEVADLARHTARRKIPEIILALEGNLWRLLSTLDPAQLGTSCIP